MRFMDTLTPPTHGVMETCMAVEMATGDNAFARNGQLAVIDREVMFGCGTNEVPPKSTVTNPQP